MHQGLSDPKTERGVPVLLNSARRNNTEENNTNGIANAAG